MTKRKPHDSDDTIFREPSEDFPSARRNIFDISRCHQSMEVRVGLSVSMTGALSRNATTEQIFKTLRTGKFRWISLGISG